MKLFPFVFIHLTFIQAIHFCWPDSILILIHRLHSSIQQQAFNDEETLHLPANYTTGWMETLDDEKFISDITLPGTHESLALHGGFIAECQAWSLEDQLKAGIRFFDFRVSGEN